MSMKPEIIYLVNNGGEYSDYEILGVFTDKILAEKLAKISGGEIEEWPLNVTPEKWITWGCRLSAEKENGRWKIKQLYAYAMSPCTSLRFESTECHLGHYAGWDEPDPETGCYTHGCVNAFGRSKEQVKKMCLDMFWKKVNELKGG